MEEKTVIENTAERTERRKWLTLLVLALGLAIVIIDGTIVNVAIPSIRKEFNTNLRSLEWVNSIYSLIYAALIVTWGRVGDQIGRKRIFIVGVSVFVAGSMLAGIAPSIGFLIAARAIQGLGAAMTSPSTLSIVSSTFTGKMRGVAFGVGGSRRCFRRPGPFIGRLADHQCKLALGFLRQPAHRLDRHHRKYYLHPGIA
jgi:MFS family permease